MEMQRQLGSSWAKAKGKIPRKVNMLRDFFSTVCRGINYETLRDIPTLVTDGGCECRVLVGRMGGRVEVVLPDGELWLEIGKNWIDLVRSEAACPVGLFTALLASWLFSYFGSHRGKGPLYCFPS